MGRLWSGKRIGGTPAEDLPWHPSACPVFEGYFYFIYTRASGRCLAPGRS
jgi:hypothetical protein